MLRQQLLDWFFKRRVTTSVTHTLVCGATRSGKSEAELARLVHQARHGDCAIVLLDPPGSLASKFLLHLHARGLDRRVIYDRLADTDRVPGYEWLQPSTHPDPLQREAENDERIREFAAILLRRRGIQDPAKTPLIEEVLLAALRLYIHQDKSCPLPWLAEVFDMRSEARSHLLANCTEPKLLRNFAEYAALSPMARRTEIAPAERILRAVLTSPAFRVRSGDATFGLGRFLDEKGILILDGCSKGNLSRDASSVMMGAIILRVIQHCRTGSKSKVTLVVDEAVNADLIGLHESRALAEAGKWQLEWHILVQDPFGFPSEEIRSNVLQNCWRHEWFRQGSPEAARLAAEDIAIPQLDPLHIHHTHYRIRTADAGYDAVRMASGSEWTGANGKTGSGTSWHTALVRRGREITDAQDRYMALQDQILLTQKALMLLKPGFRFVRADKSTARPEYVPMLRGLWSARVATTQEPGPASLGLEQCLAEMKRRPSFVAPAEHLHPSPPGALPRSAGRRLRRRGDG